MRYQVISAMRRLEELPHGYRDHPEHLRKVSRTTDPSASGDI